MARYFKITSVFNPSDSSAELRAMLADVEAHTQYYPDENVPHLRLWNDCVIFDFIALPENALMLFGFKALTIKQGHGGRALQWLTSLADKHGICITLSVQPKKNPDNPLSERSALIDFYARRGFVLTGDKTMQRLPDDGGIVGPMRPRRPGSKFRLV